MSAAAAAMLRARVFGPADAFRLELDYEHDGDEAVADSHRIHPARLELDWTGSEPEAAVAERLAQRQRSLLQDATRERVLLELQLQSMAHAASFPEHLEHIAVALHVVVSRPALRSITISHTAGSGAVPDSLLTALLSLLDLSRVQRVRGCEGAALLWTLPGTPAHLSHSLRVLALSSCGLTSLPPVVGELCTLEELRVNSNRLTALPRELGRLTSLRVLAANSNALTALPGELRRCCELRELHLEGNRLTTLLLDLTHATALASLQLYGNPLEYLPELGPAAALRSLSLANVRILADQGFQRWEVEVAAPGTAYGGMVGLSRSHKLAPLFSLIFRRSSLQHPLLVGALARLVEEPGALALLEKDDVALQQLVLAAMSSDARVVSQAVRVLATAGAHAGAVRRLVASNVVEAVTGLAGSSAVELQLAGLRVLSAIAAGCAEGEVPGDVLLPPLLLDRLLQLAADPGTHVEVRAAALHALGNSAFDVGSRRRYLRLPALMELLHRLAAPPPASANQEGVALPVASAEGGDQSGAVPAVPPSPPSPSPQLQLPPPPQLREGGQPLLPTQLPLRGTSGAEQQLEGGSSRVDGDDTTAISSTGNECSSPDVRGLSRGAEAALAVAAATAAAAAAAAVPGALCDVGRSRGSGSGSGGNSMLSTDVGGSSVVGSLAALNPASGSPLGNARQTGGAVASKAAAAAAAALDADALSFPPRRRLVTERDPVRLQAIRLLAVLGQNEQVRRALGQPPLASRRLRVLAMDGGGMRGMALVEMLRHLQRRAGGAPIWSLFDVIAGTSTGGLLAVALGLLRLDLDACEGIYRRLGRHVFNQSGTAAAPAEEAGWRDSLYRAYATGSANMRVAVYGAKHDAAPYEELLRRFCAMQELGCASDRLIDTALLRGPKVCVVATLASQRPAVPFVFRNYELPSEGGMAAEALAACPGSCKHHVWEAVRASSAAPYYLDDFVTPDGRRFQDGAATANNPAAIALQQARLLHPQAPVVLASLGCGAEPPGDRSKGLSSVIDTGAVLLESACSVDRVHEALAATLPYVPHCEYFRFNAIDPRCGMELDDIQPESARKLLAAVDDYIKAPAVASRLDDLACALLEGTEQQQQQQQQEEEELPCGVTQQAALASQQEQQRTQQQQGGPQDVHVHERGKQLQAAGPRLAFDRGVLLISAPLGAAAPPAAALAAAGRSAADEALRTARQQQEVASLIAAALPRRLLHKFDVAAALLAPMAPAGPGVSQLRAAAGGESPTLLPTAAAAAAAQSAMHSQQQPSAPGTGLPPRSSVTTTVTGAAATAAPASAAGLAAPKTGTPGSAASSKSGTWLDYFSSFSFSGSNQQQQQQLPSPLGLHQGCDTPQSAPAMRDTPGSAVSTPRGVPSTPQGLLAAVSSAPQLHSVDSDGRRQQQQQQQQQQQRAPPALPALRCSTGVMNRSRQALAAHAIAGALSSSPCRLGAVHLALPCSGSDALVCGWVRRTGAIMEPGPDADELLRRLGAGGQSLGALVLSCGPLLPLADDGAVAVLGSHAVLREPPSAHSTGTVPSPTACEGGGLLTSWLLSTTAPRGDALLTAADTYVLLPALSQLLIVSSSMLPADVLELLVCGGTAGVVAPMPGADISSLPPQEVASFFKGFYAALQSGADTAAALSAGAAAAPAVGGMFVLHQP